MTFALPQNLLTLGASATAQAILDRHANMWCLLLLQLQRPRQLGSRQCTRVSPLELQPMELLCQRLHLQPHRPMCPLHSLLLPRPQRQAHCQRERLRLSLPVLQLLHQQICRQVRQLLNRLLLHVTMEWKAGTRRVLTVAACYALHAQMVSVVRGIRTA